MPPRNSHAQSSDRLLSPAAALRQARTQWNTWLKQQGIAPARFQQQAWKAFAQGQSGIISAPTGSGKTLAAMGGALVQGLASQLSQAPQMPLQGVRMLWITPLRALASDTATQLTRPMAKLLPDWQIAMRTGDATAKDKRRSQNGQAQLIVTTPESLAILLSHAAATESFAGLQSVIVDEWHELMPSKRGVLLQLNLAHLRKLAPALQVWGLSATMGNLNEALQALVRDRTAEQTVIVQDLRTKPFDLQTVLPPPGVRLPWAGHLGLSNIGQVLKLVQSTSTSLIFTNTRAQAELWFSALSSIWPEPLETLAIHHGSLDQAVRLQVEQDLRAAKLRCVVATSSLDLGVDFPAVDRVIQVGGAHSVARTVQRAGRAKHRPGAAVHLTAVATQAMELCEFAATRDLAQQQQYENRNAPTLCLDVLAQHVMSMALAGGFQAKSLLAEVRSTAAFQQLTAAQWAQVLQFLVHGGQALEAYPQYQRLQLQDGGRYVPASLKVTRQHRFAIGTIVGQTMVTVQFLRGARIGSVEESFVSKLAPGDVFNFAGRSLELFRVENLTAWVRRSKQAGTLTPSWTGSLLPFSSQVGESMQRLLADAVYHPNARQTSEMAYLQPLLALQQARTRVPQAHELLVEAIHLRSTTRRGGRSANASAGVAWFIYPFAGRVVHEGLALLLAHRLAQRQSNTFSWSCNDIGLMLSSAAPVDATPSDWAELLSPRNLEADLRAAVNFSEIARRRFREIAQIAGLIQARAPGKGPNTRQLQVSAGLLYDVLSKYDPDHILLQSARREAIQLDLHLLDLQALLVKLAEHRLVLCAAQQHTPFSFGLWAESLRGQLSNETWLQRIQREVRKNEHD